MSNTPTYSRLTPREVMAARADDMDYNKKLADGMKYGRPLSRLPSPSMVTITFEAKEFSAALVRTSKRLRRMAKARSVHAMAELLKRNGVLIK